jgi:hypothetical protein
VYRLPALSVPAGKGALATTVKLQGQLVVGLLLYSHVMLQAPLI